ncbi:uncharacterized protein LOC134193864 [Corticium candelabrum]|uniref:uncharacterized protein LOC134193864 n=1 Tax=Corticium candelabrum TaxID=121492 RepID=UPI002E268D2B|nr:uncharacterized protein LOC134193864 [Corticium candelabrum]
MSLCLFLLASAFALCVHSLDVSVVDVSDFKLLRSCGASSLYELQLQTKNSYDVAPMLVELRGSRYDMGYAYGNLLSKEIEAAYHSLMKWILGDHWYDEVLELLFADALDWQWDDYLSIELPIAYKEELIGVRDGAAAAGCPSCGNMVTRAIALSNMPGDTQDVLLLLMREFNKTDLQLGQWPHRQPTGKATNMHCSMFGVWGSRTAGQRLFSARNLDWNKDTGVNKAKLVAVYKPDDGAIAHATVGFAGLYGALAGMSAEGLTVHEANLEEDEITWNGIPFVLRLRYVMEWAKNLSEAREIWMQTNNTVGFNHMIGSGNDAAAYANNKRSQYAALAMETMYQYTAFFHDNDAREADAVYSSKPSESVVHIGFPINEAVWRTNHGYDPVIRQHYEWSQAPSSWSMQRYMFMHEAFTSYERNRIKIDVAEAINITAIVGDKGSHAYECMDNTDGTNVLSVTYDPNVETMYCAWESKSGSDWRPACCSTYVKLDMTKFFK